VFVVDANSFAPCGSVGVDVDGWHTRRDAMNLTLILFFFFAACAAGSALAMVTRKNPVACAMWLIGTFFSVAAIYTLLGAYFIGIIQILVYAGAIMVLFLFVIMLLNLGNDYEADIRGTGWKIAAGGAALLILAFLARVFGGDLPRPLGDEAGPAALATAQAQHGVVGLIGVPLYNEYVVPLQATAILLLVAVVGAVVLAKRKV
jgi:NADH-quinone oxidoreductase subunit J